MQYLILEKLFQCRMTILGDKAQTMDSEQVNVMKFLPKIFGKQIRWIEMKKSYRNTMEIASYANSLCDSGEMELFERHGRPVQIQGFSSKQEALEQILQEIRSEDGLECETEAVITASEDEALAAWAWLKERMECNYIDRNSSHFKKGLTVTTFYLAKGLEFDRVFTLTGKGMDQYPLHRQMEYISATRAMHELHVYRYDM